MLEQSTPPRLDAPPAVPAPVVGKGVHLPALDGLRGLAVLAVLAYHLWPDTVPGGWLGVGLFFTLSGFLVIGLVVDDLDGGVDLARFYRRRVRRLLPAALATTAAVVGWVALTDPALRHSVAVDGFWAVLDLANWNQATDPGGYGAIFERTAQPLAHMWSLAIEEQFYLTAPLALAWVRRPGRVLAAGFVVFVVAQMLWWGASDAYLVTPVRIAEILVGGVLALAVRRRPGVRAVGRLWPVAAAVAIVAVLSVDQSAGVVTRGFPAAMALVWAVLVAACLGGRVDHTVLAGPVLRWVGLRSYAIYLIHWPLIELTDWSAPIVVLVTFVLAEVSYRVLEDPIRRGAVLRRPVTMLVGASVVLAVLLGVLVATTDDSTLLVEEGFADQLPAWFEGSLVGGSQVEGRAAAGARVAGAVEVNPGPAVTAAGGGEPRPAASTEAVVPSAGTGRTTPAPPATPPVVEVLGDSTATQLAAGLAAHGNARRDLAVLDRTNSGCSALIDPLVPWRAYRLSYGYLGEFRFDEPCRDPVDTSTVTPDIVLVVDHGSVLADHERPDGTWASILDADVRDDVRTVYRARIAEARDVGATIVFTTAPRLVDDTGLMGEMDDPARLTVYNELVSSLADPAAGVVVLDLAGPLDEAGTTGRYARPDGLHLDLDAATRFADDIVAPDLLAIASGRDARPDAAATRETP